MDELVRAFWLSGQILGLPSCVDKCCTNTLGGSCDCDPVQILDCHPGQGQGTRNPPPPELWRWSIRSWDTVRAPLGELTREKCNTIAKAAK